MVRKTVRQRDSDLLVQEERTEMIVTTFIVVLKFLKKANCDWFLESDSLHLQQFDCETGCDWLIQEERTEIIETNVVIK